MSTTNQTIKAGNKSILIQGVTLYFLTDEKLHLALENINAVVIYAHKDTPNRPIFFQHYCDYIDSISIMKLDLVEAVKPFKLSREVFPDSFKLAYRKKMLVLAEEDLDYLNRLDQGEI